MFLPERNGFLKAPLSKEEGGTGECGKAVFTDKDDPDYQKLLKIFEETDKQLSERPRMDMLELDEQCTTD